MRFSPVVPPAARPLRNVAVQPRVRLLFGIGRHPRLKCFPLLRIYFLLCEGFRRTLSVAQVDTEFLNNESLPLCRRSFSVMFPRVLPPLDAGGPNASGASRVCIRIVGSQPTCTTLLRVQHIHGQASPGFPPHFAPRGDVLGWRGLASMFAVFLQVLPPCR